MGSSCLDSSGDSGSTQCCVTESQPGGQVRSATRWDSDSDTDTRRCESDCETESWSV